MRPWQPSKPGRALLSELPTSLSSSRGGQFQSNKGTCSQDGNSLVDDHRRDSNLRSGTHGLPTPCLSPYHDEWPGCIQATYHPNPSLLPDRDGKHG